MFISFIAVNINYTGYLFLKGYVLYAMIQHFELNAVEIGPILMPSLSAAIILIMPLINAMHTIMFKKLKRFF